MFNICNNYTCWKVLINKIINLFIKKISISLKMLSTCWNSPFKKINSFITKGKYSKKNCWMFDYSYLCFYLCTINF